MKAISKISKADKAAALLGAVLTANVTTVKNGKVVKSSKAVSVSMNKNAVVNAMACSMIGEALVSASQAIKQAQGEAVAVVQDLIVGACKQGLIKDDLKSGQPCYLAITTAIGDSIAKGTRDNYLSRIRKFVVAFNAGEKPELDLYGNIAVKSARAAQQTSSGKSNADDTEPSGIVSSKEGGAALCEMLTHWINKNAADGSLFAILSKARELLAFASADLATRQSELEEIADAE